MLAFLVMHVLYAYIISYYDGYTLFFTELYRMYDIVLYVQNPTFLSLIREISIYLYL